MQTDAPGKATPVSTARSCRTIRASCACTTAHGNTRWAEARINYPHPYYLCYAQSSDGKSWRKPSLGMVEFEGDRNINIVLAPQRLGRYRSQRR